MLKKYSADIFKEGINKSGIVSILLAFLTSFSIEISGKVYLGNGFFDTLGKEFKDISMGEMVLGIALLIFYYKTWDLYEEHKTWLVHVISITISIFMLIGMSYSQNENASFIFGNAYQMIIALLVFAGYVVLFDVVITEFYVWLSENVEGYFWKRKIEYVYSNKNNNAWLFYFAIIFICWLPYLIINLPGSVPIDGYKQLEMCNGVAPLTNHHPWLHTLFMGFLMKIGQVVSDNAGIFLIVIVQYVIEALCYAKICDKIKEWGAPNIVSILTLLYFCIVPNFGAYAQVVMKDGIYTALFAVYVCLYIDACIGYIRENYSENDYLKKYIKIFLLGLIVCFTRNNGIYIVLPMNILLFFFSIDRGKKYAILTIVFTVVFFYIVEYPLASCVGVQRESEKEILSVPFQQTARYLKKFPDDVTVQEKNGINKVLDYVNLADLYNPYVSDPVKETFKNPSDKDMNKYFQIWAEMLMKHPGVYVESFLNGTYGYYYPFADCSKSHLLQYHFYIDPRPVETRYNLRYFFSEKIRSNVEQYTLLWRKLPILSLFMSPGAYTWLLILLAGYNIFKKKWRKNLVLIGPFLNVAICIASPVNGYVRYALPLMSCMPILIYWGLCVIDE